MIEALAIAATILAAVSDEQKGPSLAEMFEDYSAMLAEDDVVGIARVLATQVLVDGGLLERVRTEPIKGMRFSGRLRTSGHHPVAGSIDLEVTLSAVLHQDRHFEDVLEVEALIKTRPVGATSWSMKSSVQFWIEHQTQEGEDWGSAVDSIVRKTQKRLATELRNTLSGEQEDQ